jgi:putative hemolysin
MEPFILQCLILLPCAALAFCLSGLESGVFSLNRWRIGQQSKRGNRAAKLVHEYLDNSEHFLWTILVGNTLASLAVFIVSGRMLHQLAKGNLWIFIPLYLIGLFLFYTLCDLLPKTIFSAYPTRLTLWLVRPFSLLHLLLRPVVILIEGLSNLFLRSTGGKHLAGHLFGSRDEARNVMRESAQGLTSEERGMIDRVLDLHHRTVRQLTVAFTTVPRVHAGMKAEEVLRMHQERGIADLPLIPVWQEDDKARRIVGMLDLRRLLFAGAESLNDPVRDHLQGAMYLDEGMRLEQALRRMQRGGQEAAVVLGLDRREIGILRLSDILNGVFGEVRNQGA